MLVLVGHIAAVQDLVVAVVFLWAGVWKVAFPSSHAVARRSALARILRGGQRAVAAHLALGISEITVAVLLLALPPARTLALGLACTLALGFLGYLLLARRLAPDAPCACMGGRATRISRSALLRAVALLAMCLTGWSTRAFWAAALLAAPWLALVLALELAALWALSPEFGAVGARLGRWGLRAARLRLDPACARVRQDISAIERALQSTAAYRTMRPTLGARTDAWREGCWDFVAFGALYERQAATVIFAAPALFDPLGVSAAVVSDADQTILLTLPSPRGSAPPMT